MQVRLTLTLALSSLLLAACGGSSNSSGGAAPPPTNNDGSPVTGVLTARFDPSTGVVPFPTNLLLSGTTDLTLNIPVANPNNYGDPQVALNALDGWGTVSPWSASFNAAPAAASIRPGQTVRLFEVSLSGPGGAVTGIVRELAAGSEFVAALAPSDTTGRTLAIVPTKPLKQLTSYMAVLTNGLRDSRGNDATPDQAYFIAKRPDPICVNGQSTLDLLPAAQACALEPLRRLVNAQETAAAAAGISRSNIVLSWVATTQSVTPVLQAVRSTVQPRLISVAPTGYTLAVVNGLPPVADIYVGMLEVPYYLQTPSAENPTAPLNGFWRAAPGAYVPPFSQAGLSPTSTFVTFANPMPVATTTVRIPVLVTVPNAASGKSRPDSGWPVAIYQHGITRNRTDLLAVAGTLALQGFVGVSIDLPLHGLGPQDIFNIANTPFGAAGARERTFSVDYVNNETGAPGPDGVADTSGTHFINLASLLTSRDNLRQGVVDLFSLTASLPNLDFDGNGAGDVDTARVHFVGQSLGAIVGTVFLAMEPDVNVGLLSVPGGGIAQLLNGSPTFGPRIRAGLAASGVQAGTPDFDRFMAAAQTAVDSGDPINYGFASATDALILQEIVGGNGVLPDQVVPNNVAGAPLAGTDPLIRVLGLPIVSTSTTAANGVRGAIRLNQGDHGSLLNPTASTAATVEMQGHMASLLSSDGTAVYVGNSSIINAQ